MYACHVAQPGNIRLLFAVSTKIIWVVPHLLVATLFLQENASRLVNCSVDLLSTTRAYHHDQAEIQYIVEVFQHNCTIQNNFNNTSNINISGARVCNQLVHEKIQHVCWKHCYNKISSFRISVWTSCKRPQYGSVQCSRINLR